MVRHLAEATPLKEKLGDVVAAAELELKYTVTQGINRNTFQELGICMTLKLAFLFTPELSLREAKRIPYWEKMVKCAMYGGAGLLVSDLFQGDRLARAVVWMERLYARVPDNLTLSSSVFMTPRVLNKPVEEGLECVGIGDDEQPRCEDHGGDEDEQPSVVDEPRRETEMSDLADRLAVVKELEKCEHADSVMGCVRDFFSTRKSSRLASPTKGTKPYLTCTVEYDPELTWKAIRMAVERRTSLGYRKDLRERLRTQQKPLNQRDERDEDQDKDTPAGKTAVSDVVRAWCSALKNVFLFVFCPTFRDHRPFFFFCRFFRPSFTSTRWRRAWMRRGRYHQRLRTCRSLGFSR